MKHKIEYDCKCAACYGTGVYVGMAERDGAAVMCHRCKGTGQRHEVIEYEDFTKRRLHPGVTRVFECNPGIIIGRGKNGEFTLEDFGGMPYEDWLEGRGFPPHSENRTFTCPCWWYQTADYTKKPKWSSCDSALGSSFSHCPFFSAKELCWRRWDQEHTETK